MPDPTSFLDTLDDVKKAGLVKIWTTRIEDAQRREKKFREKGKKVVELYEGDKADETPFAILYSNTEVLSSAIYNSCPTPIVSRRFKDADPVGKAAAETSTRILKFLLDAGSDDYENYNKLMETDVLSALLVNRGVTRFRYCAEENGKYPEGVFGEGVRWDKFFHGYARTWKKVPWIGFEWDMTPDEIKENFPDISPLDFRTGASTPEEDNDSGSVKDELQGVSTYKVYEIWDKATRRVMFFSGVSKDSPLRIVDDPLGVSGFFPVPEPMNFLRKITTLIPVPLYEHYRSQARELNDITLRLKAIIKAIKYRGAYNSAVSGIEKMLRADDNELVPVENVQSMPDGTGMDKLLWIVPVNELVATAQSLYQQRESCKNTIYEITGISDILRGASIASETATAQQLKSQWGTMRLRKMQAEVQRYCRDALAIMNEIACKKFEIPTMRQMTGLPYLSNTEKMQIQQNLQQQQQMAQFQASMAPPPAPGQPPAPPPQPPQLDPQTQALLTLPSWEDIAAVLQNDIARAYKTDIETDSTIEASQAQDKQDIAELFNAMAQFMSGLAPLVQEGVMPMEIAKEMLLVVVRRYNFGSQLEDMLAAMQPPQQQPGGQNTKGAEAQAKLSVVQAQAQADLAQTQAESQANAQAAQQKMALMEMEFNQKQQLMQNQHEYELAKIANEKTKLMFEIDKMNRASAIADAQHQQKMAALAVQGEKTGVPD